MAIRRSVLNGAAADALLDGLRRRHFFDYPDTALRIWVATVLVGCIVTGLALHGMLTDPALDRTGVAVALVLVAVAATQSVTLTGKLAVTVSEAFVFAILAAYGPSAAVVAAVIDGAVGSRNSKRVTSRIANPCISAISFGVCAMAFEVYRRALESLQVAPTVASVASLMLCALLPFAVSIILIKTLLTSKTNGQFTPRAWLRLGDDVAALYLCGALIAGMTYLGVERFGPTLLLVFAVSVLAVIALFRNALARREAERQDQQQQIDHARTEAQMHHRRFDAAFTDAAIGMALTASDGRIVQVNRALLRLLECSSSVLIGQPVAMLLDRGDAELLDRHMQLAASESAQAFSIELRLASAKRTDLWVAIHGSHIDDRSDSGASLILQLHDISARRIAEKWRHVAYHDDLTDLANRNFFRERLMIACEHAMREPQRRFSILFLDLDQFKQVNDTLGHQAGNELLIEVAGRLRRCAGANDVVARLGGDEFAILVEDTLDSTPAEEIANRILSALRTPLSAGSWPTAISASIGITTCSGEHGNIDDALRDADDAMYEAKSRGGNQVVLAHQIGAPARRTQITAGDEVA
jgi:diguanylate cyclase (GGDEF)-like protein/PAS domain S-box-containing protein